jgi:deoxycytidine triphosphate deaminase
MAVLSDRSIKDLIANCKLIEGVGDEHAMHCAFHFPAGKIYVPGTQETIDWTDGAEAKAFYGVKPGQLVWVRPLGRVTMPNDLCAFWWQTNTLSRKGLMLVNMSMVEPGYKGHLSCLFVNFGKNVVPIHKGQPIAKLVFMKVDQAVERPYQGGLSDGAYDQALVEQTMVGPQSFLQIAELSSRFAEAASDFDRQKSSALADFEVAANAARTKFRADIEQDSTGVFKRTFGWAVLAFAVLALLTTVATWIKTNLTPDVNEVVRKAVSEEVARRMIFAAEPSQQDAGVKPSEDPPANGKQMVKAVAEPETRPVQPASDH